MKYIKLMLQIIWFRLSYALTLPSGVIVDETSFLCLNNFVLLLFHHQDRICFEVIV